MSTYNILPLFKLLRHVTLKQHTYSYETWQVLDRSRMQPNTFSSLRHGPQKVVKIRASEYDDTKHTSHLVMTY